MLTIQNILDKEGKDFIDKLFDSKVTVTEKLNASTLSFCKRVKSEMDENPQIAFYKGKEKNEITLTDNVCSTFFKMGIDHISSISNLIMDQIPNNWTFVCSYFPTHQPSFITYSVLPKNGLVLTTIFTDKGDVIDDKDQLQTYADLFDIAFMEPVFDGYLTKFQKEELEDYINGKRIFDDNTTFSKFIITLLNPNLKNSLYQEGFTNPVDCFVFRFTSDNGKSKPTTCKLVDPCMQELIAKNKAKNNYNDNKDILISDFTLFLSKLDLEDYILSKKEKQQRYLELFCKIFNKYIQYKKDQLESFEVDKNEIVKESIDKEFDIDFDNLENETTKKLLKEYPECKDVFKTLLGSFTTKKDDAYVSIVMAPGIVRLFNDLVDKIDTFVDKEPSEYKNLSFDEYLSKVKVKNIETLDLENAPKEVKKEVEQERKNLGQALSFDEYLQKMSLEDQKEKEEEEERKREKESIDDMINKLQDQVKDLRKELKEKEEEDKKKEEEEKKEKEKEEKKEKEEEKKEEEKKEEEKEDEEKEDEEKEKKDEKEDEEKEEKEDDKGDEENTDEDEEDDDDEDESPLDSI